MPQRRVYPFYILSLILALGMSAFGADDGDDLDLILTPQFGISPDTRVNGFAGAGCAVLEGISALYTNPALPYAFGTANLVSHFVVEGGYGRDPVYQEHAIPVGLSALLGEGAGTVGLFYRYLKSADERTHHEGVLNYSSRMFEKNGDQGEVDYGFNIRYERTEWEIRSLDSLEVLKILLRDPAVDTLVGTAMAFDGRKGLIKNNRLILDVGFYQGYIAERVDFGLTLHNILGYVWQDERPSLTQQLDTVSTKDTSTLQEVYVDETHSTADWLNGDYRRMTVGMAFRTPILGDKANILLPIDVGFLGLFGDMRARVTLRTGLEVSFLKHFSLRGGYARAPRTIVMSELRDKKKNVNENILTCGGGIKLAPFSADFHIGKDEFGVGLRIVL